MSAKNNKLLAQQSYVKSLHIWRPTWGVRSTPVSRIAAEPTGMSNSSNDEVLIIEEAPSPETTNTAVALRSAKTQLTSRFPLTVDRLFKRGRDSEPATGSDSDSSFLEANGKAKESLTNKRGRLRKKN